MKVKSSILGLFALLLAGCVQQATPWVTTTDPGSDLSAVTIRKVNAASYEQKLYNDPLNYYYNGFDDLYFN